LPVSLCFRTMRFTSSCSHTINSSTEPSSSAERVSFVPKQSVSERTARTREVSDQTDSYKSMLHGVVSPLTATALLRDLGEVRRQELLLADELHVREGIGGQLDRLVETVLTT
jgi:hypothetical protein